jgi:tetratricopeptide (TPR) repeat protein
MSITRLIFLAVLGFAGPASAQRLYFGSAVIDWSEVTLSGTNLIQKGATGKSIPASNVTRVDWPYPDELNESLDLILKQKYDQAMTKANTVREVHKNWKDKPGSWYVAASLLTAESFIRKNNLAESDKILAELKTLTLTPSQRTGVDMMEALESFQKSMTGPAIKKAESLIKSTDDSATLGRLWVLIGDIKFKQGNYLEALDSYLQVPVFYGSQGAQMPIAELGAARSLMHLGRLSDASKALTLVIERYKGTPEAAAAQKDKEDVDKALTGGSPAPAKAEEKPKDGAKAKDDEK